MVIGYVSLYCFMQAYLTDFLWQSTLLLFLRILFDNSSFLKTLSINKFHDLKVIILHVSIIVIVILFLEDLVAFGGTLANLYAGISSSLVILAIIFTCKLLDNDHHKDDE